MRKLWVHIQQTKHWLIYAVFPLVPYRGQKFPELYRLSYNDGEEEAFLGYDNFELDGVKLLKQRTVKQKNKTILKWINTSQM